MLRRPRGYDEQEWTDAEKELDEALKRPEPPPSGRPNPPPARSSSASPDVDPEIARLKKIIDG